MLKNLVNNLHETYRLRGLKEHIFFKQWEAIVGKEGCELDGVEIKEWPINAA